jgi:hypothetical protein
MPETWFARLCPPRTPRRVLERWRGGGKAQRLTAGATAISLTVFVTAGTARSAGTGTGDPRHVVHPIFVNVPDAPQDALAEGRFDRAAQQFGLGPVEVVVIEAPHQPEVTDRLKAGIALVTRLDLGRGLATLDEVASEVAATGGAGLDARALADLYFYRGWAVSRLDFNPAHVPEGPARAQGYGDLIRAAVLDPHRTVDPTRFPPLLAEDWARARADVRERDQFTVVVHAAPESFVTLDGGNPIRGPATFVGVASGEHLVHVDEPSFAPWGGTILVDRGPLDVAVPERRTLTLPDAEAAARARRMGRSYALVAEPRPGLGGLSLALRLVDLRGTRRDSAIAQLAGDDGALDAAVMRLDEQARRMGPSAPPPPERSAAPVATGAGNGTSALALPGVAPGGETVSDLAAPVLIAPGPARSSLRDDPAGWSRQHWALLTAVGVMLAATLILSVGVASDH